MRKLFQNAAADIPASVVVFLVALPLCLGIALGSGAPLFSGIIAGMVGGIVIGFLSGSSLSISGPAAGLTAIVAVAIGKMPAYEAFLLSVVIAGILQIIIGLFTGRYHWRLYSQFSDPRYAGIYRVCTDPETISPSDRL